VADVTARAGIGVLVFLCVLLGDARPGWCPFSEPSPGAGIQLPHSISAPQPPPPPPPPALYAVFDRSRVVQKGRHVPHSGPGPPMSEANEKPNMWHGPAVVEATETQNWMGNPLWTTSACLFLALIGLLPLLWMRRAARITRAPMDVAPSSWRGWTQRPGRGSRAR